MRRYAAAPMSQPRSLAHQLSGMRLLSIALAGLWAAVGLAVLIAYQPGGPFDVIVRAAVFGPLPIAIVAVVWPPRCGSWRATAAVAWLGLLAGLLLMPLLGGVLETLRGPGRQALFPSAEVAYAGLLALGMTSLYAAIGVVGAHARSYASAARPTLSRSSFVQALSLAVAATGLASLTLGLPSLANELALRDRPLVASRFGPTDTTLPLPRCEQPPLLGGSAVLEGDGAAFIDGKTVGSIELRGARQGTTLEDWVATRGGVLGAGGARYHRVGQIADLVDGRGSATLAPADLGLADPRGLSVDGPIAATVSGESALRLAEDRGIELIEEARSRHCRITIDGPLALSASVLVRLLVDGSLQPRPRLEAWRGALDWWVFADGELGQAVLTIGGYPGDAWGGGGLQGSIMVHATATGRTGSPIMPLVKGISQP